MKDKAPKDFELIKRAIEKISYNFLTKLSRNRKEIFTSILLLFLVPICIFLFGQLLCYGKLIFETGRMVFNFLLIFFVIGIFYSNKSSDNITHIVYCIIKYILSPKLYVYKFEQTKYWLK